MGDLMGALSDYDAAIRIDPWYAHAWGSRAVNLVMQGKDDQAAKDMEQCASLDGGLKSEYENTIQQARAKRDNQRGANR